MFSSLKLNSSITKLYETDDLDSDVLNNLSRLNIFIGPNNSGKSQFLRDIFISNNLEFEHNSISFKKLIFSYKEFFRLLNSQGYEKFYDISIHENMLENQHYPLEKLIEIFSKIKSLPKNFIKDNRLIRDNKTFIRGNLTESNLRLKLFENWNYVLKYLYESEKEISSYSNIYVPILRGLRGINVKNDKINNNDNYKKRTIDDYFVDYKDKLNEISFEKSIYTGLSFYDDVRNSLLNSKKNRKFIKDFEDFLSISFFNNKPITIIPHIEDNVVHINIGDGEEEYPIFKLGEGIQSIIILTYPLFLNKNKHLKVYIEEPDIFLHPGYQRILIETLLNSDGFQNFQYFFTTHSNHFLDMTLDYKYISVYRFDKLNEKSFQIENIDNPDLTLLEHLGVKNSSVFLTNCTIWVEGITERIYFRKYLELYQNSLGINQKLYLEDVHFSFVEYSGSNITHLSFLDNPDNAVKTTEVDKLCAKAFVISDSDGAAIKSKKGQRIETLRENLGENYYCLNARELENLLTKEIILQVLKELDSEKDKSKIFFNSRAKFHNQVKLGEFIDKYVIGKNKKYKAKSGTILNKVKFAQTAVEKLTTFEDLSSEAKIVTTKLYNFIKSQNS